MACPYLVEEGAVALPCLVEAESVASQCLVEVEAVACQYLEVGFLKGGKERRFVVKILAFI